MPITDQPNQTSEGRQKVYPTHRPVGLKTYFTCAGDDQTIGDGPSMKFNMGMAEVSKSVDLVFNEDIWIKDAYYQFEGAPLGSYLDIELVDPITGVIGSFGRQLCLLGTDSLPIKSEDREFISAGTILRVTCYNADGLGGNDMIKAFKAVVRIECYRQNTV